MLDTTETPDVTVTHQFNRTDSNQYTSVWKWTSMKEYFLVKNAYSPYFSSNLQGGGGGG